MWRLFPGTPSRPDQSNKVEQHKGFVTIHWLTNIHVIPIDYAFRPRLRDRLTLRRLTLRRNPWTFGDTVFHSVCRYSCQHIHFSLVQHTSRYTFVPSENAPLPLIVNYEPKASVQCLAPLHFRRRIARPVSYYAFFKGWLLLSQRPGCLNGSTTFTTEHGFGDLSCWSGLFPFRPRAFAPIA